MDGGGPEDVEMPWELKEAGSRWDLEDRDWLLERR